MAGKISFEGRLELMAKRNGLTMKWQSLRFGLKRAMFECSSFGELNAVEQILEGMKGVEVDRWICAAGGVFEGVVYAMEASAKEELDKELLAEKNRLEDWWQRYHVADEETRRLMACGALA